MCYIIASNINTRIIISHILNVVNWDVDSNFSTIFDKFKTEVPELTDIVKDFYEGIKDIPLDEVDWDMFYDGCDFADKEFIKFVNDTDVGNRTLETYQNYMKKASSATSKFGATLKSVAANIGIMLAINLVVKAATEIWDYYNVTVEETKEKIDEINSSLETLQSEFDELSSREPETLSKSEQARLDYLDTRIAKEKELLEVQQARLNQELVGGGFTDYFDEDSYTAKMAKEQGNGWSWLNLLIPKGITEAWEKLKGGTSDNVNTLASNTEKAISTYNSVAERIETLKKAQEGLNQSSRQYYELQNQINALESGQDYRSNNMQEQLITWKEKIANYETEIETLDAIINNSFSSSDTIENAIELKTQYEKWLTLAEDYVLELETILKSPVEVIKSMDVRLVNVTKEQLQEAFTDEELSILVQQVFDEEASIEDLKNLLATLETEADNEGGVKVNVWAGSFTEDQSTLIDEFQSKVKSLGDTLSSIQSGEDIDYTDLIQEFPELQGKAENLEESIKLLVQDAWQELQTTMGEGLPSDVRDDLQETVDKLQALSGLRLDFDYVGLNLESKVSSIQSAYDTLISAMQQYNEQGYLDMDMIDSLIALDDIYINALIDENGQLQYNAEAFKNLAVIKLEEAKASLYQELCTELVRIKELDTALAAQELALANGTLTESAYETAKALYEEILAMGDANSELAKSKWDTTEKKVALLDNQLKNVTTSTYDFSKASSSTTQDTKETIDWIETKFSRIQRTITNLGKTVSATYKQWSTRNNALAQEMSTITHEITTQQQAYDAYMAKANSVGLSEEYKELVRNGGLRIDEITDETVQENIKLYQEW